jgi:photosystem II stability/assembly factor-like uncharacterized protein
MLARVSCFCARRSRAPWRRAAGFWFSATLLGIAGVSTAAEPEWTSIGPTGQSIGNIVIAHADHPNRSPARVIILAGTLGSGIFRSSDQGATWLSVNSGLTDRVIWSLAIHQREVSFRAPITRYETVIYAGTNAGVFRSLDGGAEWRAVNTGLAGGPSTIWALATDSIGTVYASTSDGVFKSVDEGGNWISISQGIHTFWGSREIAVDSRNPLALYAGLGSLFGSVDGGQNWTDLKPGSVVVLAFHFQPVRIRISPFSAEIYMMGLADCAPCGRPPFPAVVKSDDSGASWRDMGYEFYDAVDFAFPDEATVLAARYSSRVSRSTDHGATWQSMNAGFPVDQAFAVLELAWDPVSPGTVYAATTQGVFRSGPAPASGLPRVVQKRQSLSGPVVDR